MTKKPASDPPSGRAARRFLSLAVLAGAAFAVWWLAGLGSTTTEAPPVAFDNTAAGVAYVGSEACKECHADLCTSHAHTYHGRSFGSVDPEEEALPGAFLHHNPGLSYEMYARDGKARMREYLEREGQVVDLADHGLLYFLGSPRRLRTYAVEGHGGALAQTPVSSYPKSKKWVVSLGFEGPPYSGFSRQLTAKCLGCHVGRVEEPADPRKPVRILEEAIGCETCHGPGSLHVERHRSGPPHEKGAFDPTIMNPRRGTRDQALDVCSRCHDPVDLAVDRPGRTLLDWRPGRPLGEFRVRYRMVPDDGKLLTVGHADQLRESLCFQAAGELRCSTCHDGHAPLESENRPAHYRAVCITCHKPADCGMEERERLQTTKEDACVVCHMPRVAEPRPHGVFTLHHIAVHRAPDTGPRKKPEPPRGPDGQPVLPPPERDLTLEPVGGVGDMSQAEQQRNLALALILRLSGGLDNPAQLKWARKEARQKLEEAKGELANDPVLLGALCILMDEGENSVSLEYARAVLESKEPPPRYVRVTVLSRAARILFLGRQHEECAGMLEELTAIRGSADDWIRLATVYREMDQRDAALRCAEAALAVQPEDPDANLGAARVFEWLGKKVRALEHDRIAEQLIRNRGR